MAAEALALHIQGMAEDGEAIPEPSTIDDVAEAQRLLTQSEIDDALARLGVWRGLLGIATAAGDIQPFVAEVNQ